jgi:glycosyltransferase involved in cell wall biosynthesis
MSDLANRAAVSVIIPFRDAAPYLPALLASLEAQQVDEPWEVVAVDNRSRDGSSEVAAAFVHRLPLVLTAADGRDGPAYTRNAGARIASGQKLLFIDADDEVAPGYVAAMSRALAHHDLVTSRVDSSSLNPQWAQGALGSWQTEGVSVHLGFLPAAGANIGVRRETFERLKGFPEDFTESEDIAFSWNAHLAGVRIHFVGEALYRYRYRGTRRALFRQAVRWGRDNVQLFRRYRALGMPARPVRQAYGDWRDASMGWLRARGRAQSAPYVVKLGMCVGRLSGTVRYRVPYL